ncbi:hypothetical protein C8Q76DRAFT_800999 [Earliella scabrosa]|nr:hypothetical protein C8Q76DRAFT_800999 [Earliella scabrosa]
MAYFSTSPCICTRLTPLDTADSTPEFTRHRDIRRVSPFITTSGLSLWVYESDSVSACSPISRTFCSALMNFVTEYSFGCAYPRLTLSKKSLQSDLSLDTLSNEDYTVSHRLKSFGFEFATHPAEWPEYRNRVSCDATSNAFPCFHDKYICPDQGRYFGDKGSLVAFMDTLGVDPAFARARGIMPFGHAAAWRLWNSSRCVQLCAFLDDLLHEGVVSMPLFIAHRAVLPEYPYNNAVLDYPRSVTSPPPSPPSRVHSAPP